jgi:hypothetical protein
MKKKNMRSILLFAGILFVAGFAGGEAVNAEGDNAAGISLNVRYYNKKIYYLRTENPIYLMVTVTNHSPALYHFRLADDRAFSIDIDARTLANRPLPSADVLVRKRATAGKVFFRDVSIESGESFSFIENLRDFVDITEPGNYVLSVRLYPTLLHDGESARWSALPVNAAAMSSALVSNRVPLHIKPPVVTGDDGLPVALDKATDAVLVRETIPPDEVVQWTLTARQKAQWEKYFLYLNVEKLLARDGSRERRWRAASEEERLRMVADYRQELQQAKFDGDIASIPMDFTIERTTYNARNATVIVLERFKTGGYIEKKRYTYYLERQDNCWEIIDYVVQNLGTDSVS